MATSALGREQFVQTVLAIRFSLLLKEIVWSQLLSAVGTIEASRMPLTAHRVHWIALCNDVTNLVTNIIITKLPFMLTSVIGRVQALHLGEKSL